ncbi:MAG: glutamate ABC transporter substrate-binding protein [Sciscionella sp.]
MSWRTRRKRALLVVAVFAVLGGSTAGCASDRGPVDLAPAAGAATPMPQGAKVGATDSSASVDGGNCGDPTASLSPGALPAPGRMPAGTTMAKIQERGYLIAGVDQNTFLFGYRNPNTGNLEGFDIDMAHQVADAIFGDPAKVRFKVINSAQRVSSLQHGDVDIVARTMTVNCERKQDVSFSAVYYLAGQQVLVAGDSTAKSLDDLGGKRVCAALGSTSLDHIAANAAKPVPVAVDDWSDCLVLLQQNQVDAVSTDDTILAGMAAQDPNVHIVGDRFTKEPYGLAMPKQDADFVRFVNGVLEKIRGNHQWQASYDRWLRPRLDSGTGQPKPTYSG